MAAGDIQAAADQFRYQLDKREQFISARLIRMYRPAYEQMGRDADRLAFRIAQARAEGVDVNPAWLFQQERYQTLQGEMGRALKQYGKDAGDYVDAEMGGYVQEAAAAAKGLSRVQGIRGTWADLNTE